MKFYNRVRVFTATTGNGTTIALGSAFSDAFLTLAEAGGVVGQKTVVVVEEGDDFAIYRVTIGASAGSIDIDSVTVSKIGGTVSTARMNLGGKAMVRFIEEAEDLNDILARIIALEALATVVIPIIVFNSDEDVETGDNAANTLFRVPATMDGMNVVDVEAAHTTAGSGAGSDTTDIQIRRVRSKKPVDVLSTKLSIDEGQVDSATATAPAAINGLNDDLATGDQLFVDVDALVSGTAPNGLVVNIHCRLP